MKKSIFIAPILVIVICLVAGCSSGPSDEDWAELIQQDTAELTDIKIKKTYRTTGNWIAVKGSAVLGEDKYDTLTPAGAVGFCKEDTDLHQFIEALESKKGKDPKIVQAGPKAGTKVELDMEFVPKKVSVGTVTTDGYVYTSDDVTKSGWTIGAFDNTYFIEGESEPSNGFPVSWFVKFKIDLDKAVHIGSDEFNEICKLARNS